jgi:hypothetical protein
LNIKRAPKAEDADDGRGSNQALNEQSLYTNQLMRGYIKFA